MFADFLNLISVKLDTGIHLGGMVRYGTVRYGTVRQAKQGYGKLRHGKVRYVR